MKRLRLQFALFFLLLAGTAGALVFNSYRQMGLEERVIWRGAAEKVFNQMQATVSEFLTVEDRRHPTEYLSPTSSINSLTQDDPRGLIAYFQLDPEGNVSTPQASLKEKIKSLTSSLKFPPTPPSKPKGYVELGQMEPQKEIQNIYPNPVQEQAVRLEKKKMAAKAAPQLAAKMEEVFSADEKAMAPAATVSALPPPAPIATSPRPVPVMNILPPTTDPFQARLVSEKFLIFYRKAWIDQRPQIQGFVVELDRFFNWLMDQSFANSDLPDFSLARLELEGGTLAQYGVVPIDPAKGSAFFLRPLGYPLSLFTWAVSAERLPRLAGRLFLNLLTATVFLLMTFGLLFIYRSAAAEILLSQKRQDFVSAVTHELKTPLTSIRMYSEMLEDGWAKDDEKKREYYRQISRESGRLSRLIENILQMARLEKKTYRVNLMTADPRTDFGEIGRELGKIATAHGFSLSLRVGPDIPTISYDPEATKQILISLLDNSIKFGAESSDKSMEMTLSLVEGRVAWSFNDRGPGIPPKEMEKVFENFYRVENEMTRKTKGTGIGLAMCRMLAEAMGAQIDACRRDGGGLQVTLTFQAESKKT